MNPELPRYKIKSNNFKPNITKLFFIKLNTQHFDLFYLQFHKYKTKLNNFKPKIT